MLLLLLHCKWCWNTHIYGSIRKQHSNWSTDISFFTSFEELNGKFKVYLILRGRWIKNIFQFYILDWALRVILQFDYLIQNNLMVLIYRLPRKDKLIQFGLFSIAKKYFEISSCFKMFCIRPRHIHCQDRKYTSFVIFVCYSQTILCHTAMGGD